MNITVPALLSLARAIGNDPVVTLGNKRLFRVQVLDQASGLEFVPEATKFRRRVSVSEIDAVLQKHRESNSLRRSDYTGVSFNASYLLALIKHFMDQDLTGGTFSAEKLNFQFQKGLSHALTISDEELAGRLMTSPEQPQKVLVASSAFVRNPYSCGRSPEASGWCVRGLRTFCTVSPRKGWDALP